MSQKLGVKQADALAKMKLHAGFNLPFELLKRLPALQAVVYQYLLTEATHGTENEWIPVEDGELQRVFGLTVGVEEAVELLVKQGIVSENTMLHSFGDDKPLSPTKCYHINKVMCFKHKSGWKEAEYAQ